MTRFNEFFFTPKEYVGLGDKLIESPPLIRTSLKELNELGWCLNITHRYVKGYNHSRIKFHFYDPDKQGNPFITFKLWKSGPVIRMEKLSDNPDRIEALNRHTLLKLLLEENFKFSLTKQPVFNLLPHKESVGQQVVKEVIVHRVESEIEFLERMNNQRLEKLRKDTQYGTSEILYSQERVAS